MILKAEDCIAAGICSTGQMRFCRQHGIDFRAFHRDGIPVDDLAHIDDGNLSRAIEKAKIRTGEAV